LEDEHDMRCKSVAAFLAFFIANIWNGKHAYNFFPATLHTLHDMPFYMPGDQEVARTSTPNAGTGTRHIFIVYP
jgi:hypothetical protein